MGWTATVHGRRGCLLESIRPADDLAEGLKMGASG